MTTTQIVILVLVLLVVAAIAAALVAQSRKRKHLQSTFGPEYDRTVESSDRRRDAERELAEREQRRKQLDIRPLPAEDRRMFAERWRATQADFVDQPEQAVRQADTLVAEVMGRRGYPVGDFEQMSRDVSVDHANVVHEYRAAHEISELNDRQQASTEQLRQAMVHYRALFTDLLSDTDDGDRGAHERTTSDAGLAHEGRTTDRSATSGSGRSESVHPAADEDHVHTRTSDTDRMTDDRRTDDRLSDDRRSDDRATSDRTATDDLRADDYRTDRVDHSRIDTSRADGVRVEPGGLNRNRLEDQDRPRA